MKFRKASLALSLATAGLLIGFDHHDHHHDHHPDSYHHGFQDDRPDRGRQSGLHDPGCRRKGCRSRGHLVWPGPFTVFAPTNAAFAALPAGTVTTLLQPQNRAMPAKILTYHVVPGALMA